jgi:outer membrane protein assembly factor BamB
VNKLNRRISLFVAVVLIVVVVAALLAVSYENGLLTPTRILWQRDIENFATGLAAADGKVFTIDIWGKISCYEAQSGKSVWNGSIGAYWGAGLAASDSMVYGGKSGAEVGALDAATGEFQWIVKASVSSDLWDKRAPADITVLEDRMFATADGFGAYNATTGQLLWEYTDNGNRDANATNPNWLIGWPLEGNRVFAAGGVLFVGYYCYRIDPDNGTMLWSVRHSTMVRGPPVAFQGHIIMCNGSQGQTTVFSLNETSGASLWSYNVGVSIYQLTAYNGLLLFGGSDGNFYALHLANGTLAWKTHVDSQNITALSNSDNPLKVFPIQIDSQNQRGLWSFAVTTQNKGSQNGNDHYTGSLCSLDVATGSIIWTKQFESNGDISHESAPFSLALTENYIYLTASNDLWVLRKSAGNAVETQHFDHYALPPVALDNNVFVAADLSLIAYR